MRRLSIRPLPLFAAILMILLIAGCGANLYHKGSSAFDRGDYTEAIAAFEDAVAREPGKAIVWRQLGIAYYKTDQYDKAVDALKQAALLDPDDGTTILYLGLSNEVLGNETEAIQTYRAYLLANPDDEMSSRVRRRVRYLSDTKLRNEVKAVIQNESEIDAEKIPANTVGVLGFKTDSVDQQYAVLGRGLAEMLTTDLAKISAITVVERMRLNEIRSELKLSQSDMVDRETAPRFGKLMGVATIVTGELAQPTPEDLHASAGLINTAKGMAAYPDEVDGKLRQFFTLQKKLTYNILDEMGYVPTEDEKLRIDSIPTTSLLAFLAYSRGLAYADEGEFRLAEAEFQAAIDEDPQFEAASSALQEIAGLGDYSGSVEPAGEFESDLIERADVGVPQPQSGAGLGMTHGVIGFQVDEAAPREGDNPRVHPRVRGGVTITGTFYPDEP
ncbi:MAG: tetratricopeptide repeat protein [candidate division Zixibacteria bacterium]|nr:tetratricopeptide repeat protein [candidate division Zixibacteria bacterium]